MTATALTNYPPTLAKGQAIVPLTAGDTAQVASYATPWLATPPGGDLQLTLTVTSLTAATTASFSVETCNTVTGTPPTAVAVDTPQQIGSFQGAQGAIVPSAPFVSQMSGSGVCGNYIRLVANVGNGATCAWTVNGKAITSAHANQV